MFHVYDYRETPAIGYGFLKVNDVIPRIVDITVDFIKRLPKYSKFRSKVRQDRCEVQSSY